METRAGNVLENTRSCSRGDSLMLTMAYDGSGRRVSKTRYSKACISETSTGATSERTYAADWERELVTRYTGIGTEVRENYRDGSLQNARVVVNMPQGLGRYGVEDAEKPSSGNATFEWYFKNHLGSTMLVYGTGDGASSVKAAYDYRAFGEQVTLSEPTEKVTENFTGKEKDDETELNYFGARYLDPMIGLWMSVDPKRQFASPYLYAGNGVNPVNGVDPDGNEYVGDMLKIYNVAKANNFWNSSRMEYELTRHHAMKTTFGGNLRNDLTGNYRGFKCRKGDNICGDISTDRYIGIQSSLSPIERAATLVHETLEGEIPAQPWHVGVDDMNQFSDNANIGGNYKSHGDFLEANYNDELKGKDGRSYPSDEIYKAEFESLNGI